MSKPQDVSKINLNATGITYSLVSLLASGEDVDKPKSFWAVGSENSGKMFAEASMEGAKGKYSSDNIGSNGCSGGAMTR